MMNVTAKQVGRYTPPYTIFFIHYTEKKSKKYFTKKLHKSNLCLIFASSIKSNTMSHNLIIISAQCFENYGTPDSPHWKPKGEQKFNLEADTDHFFYGEEACIKAINTLLERHHSNDMWKFEYRSHEIIFHKPIVLDSDEFEAELDEVLSK